MIKDKNYEKQKLGLLIHQNKKENLKIGNWIPRKKWPDAGSQTLERCAACHLGERRR